MMIYKLNFSVFLFFLISSLCLAQTYEKEYAERIQQQLGGQREVAIPSGYVDLKTDQYAIEIEFARKWKQAIGQALWYGLQTNKQAGIVLIKRKNSDHKYVIQLGSVLQHAGLDQAIKVWVYPDDFSTSSTTRNPSPPPPSANQHWLTISSKTRHNSTCRYFNVSAGRVCRPDEGKACKLCGG